MPRRACVAFALPTAVCAVLLAPASGAGAATTASLVRDPEVAIGSGRAVYRFTLTTAPGERNDINLTVYPSTGARLTDAAAGVVAGPGCVVNAGELRCDVPAGGSAEAHLPASIDLGEGDDRLRLRTSLGYAGRVPGDPATLVVHGGPGADDLDVGIDDYLPYQPIADGGPGADVIRARTVTYADRTAPVSVTDDGLANDGEAGEGDDVRATPSARDPALKSALQVIGGRGDDHLTGDVVEGGDGDDRVAASWRADGGAGNDVLSVVQGGLFGRVELKGSDGDDRLIGGAGDDLLTGGPGADVVRGGEGRDELGDFWATPRPVRITLDDRAGDGPEGENDDIGADVENVSGGAGDDTLIGSDGANVLNGGAGNDVIDGRGGDDELLSQGAASHLIGGTGRDRITAPMSAAIDLRDGELDYVACAGRGRGRPSGERDPIDVLEGCQATVAVSTVRLRLRGARGTAVALRCTYGGPVCRGVMTLRLAGVAGSSVSARFVLRPGTGRPIPVTLPARAAARLRRDPQVVAEARVVIDDTLQRSYWQSVNGPDAPFYEKDLTCHPPGREVLRTAAQAIYFQRIDRPDRRYACLKGARMGVEVPRTPDQPSRLAGDLQFAGPFMTVQRDESYCTDKSCIQAEGVIVDLRTDGHTFGVRSFVAAVRVRANTAGDAALIVRDYPNADSEPGYPPGPGPFRIDLVDAFGRRTVDRGPGIDPTFLTVNGRTVTWRHDGVERTAQLARRTAPR